MCTVTYLPRAGRGYVLTSNRDEAPGRRAVAVATETMERGRILFPRDTGAGGTWIAGTDGGRSACLLNGAWQAHRRQPPYRISRGLMMLQFFRYPDPEAFAAAYRFAGIEPFTLVACDGTGLHELRWDGERLAQTRPDPERPHIWSSPTLYPPEWQAERERWFAAWAEAHPDPGEDDILHFHRHGGRGDPHYDVVMDRGGMVCTTSITQLRRQAGQLHLRFESLLRREVEERQWDLRREVVG